MQHVTMVETASTGYLGKCETCGERNTEFGGYGEQTAWCDEHEWAPRKNQRGARPGLKVLEKMYRERSGLLIYTPEEREQWLSLADELAERIKSKKDPIDGQIALFDDQGET